METSGPFLKTIVFSENETNGKQNIKRSFNDRFQKRLTTLNTDNNVGIVITLIHERVGPGKTRFENLFWSRCSLQGGGGYKSLYEKVWKSLVKSIRHAGDFQLETSELFNEFMTELGVNWVTRNIANNLYPVQKIR